MPQKAKKAKKTKAPRKPQPLPRSVQALLKYLGGSDVRVGGGARGGQPAQLAPTSINIAVSQQQQQQQSQAQQSVRARVAPKGEPIGKSPLAAVIPQQPVIVQQAPASTAETERKIQAQAREAEVKQTEINRKFGLLEADARQFRQAAATAYQDIKRDINRRLPGDANIFDARNIAERFSRGTTSRPVVEEPQFQGMSFGARAGGGAAREFEAEGITVTEVFRGAREEEESSGLGEFLGGQYIKNVSSPEMTAIERPKRGRPRKTEEEKKATKLAAAQRKKESKLSTAETQSSATLLEQRAPATIANWTPVEIKDPSALFKKPKTPKKLLVTRAISQSAPDMATQIAMLTGGGAAAPAQSSGKTIADLLGMSKNK
jgi:hypothetical protein